MAVRPLHRILLAQSELMARGHGRLRFYSYSKDALGALRVCWFALHANQSADCIATATDPLLVLSTHGFDRVPSYMYACGSDDEPIASTADSLAPRWSIALGQSDTGYAAWHNAMLATCGSVAFPITEEPGHAGFGERGNWCRVVLAPGSSPEMLATQSPGFAKLDEHGGLLIPRPPRFAVAFPERDARRTAEQAAACAEIQRVATNKLEWQKRVAVIGAQIAARKR